MADIRHTVHIRATPERVFEQVSTCEGVRRWWTPRVEGDHERAGRMIFHFGSWDGRTEVEVEERTPRRVVWRVIANNEGDEWPGTRIRFDLEPERGGTRLRFAHAGWRDASDYFAECNVFWGHFMDSLRRLAEQGVGQPR